MLTEGRKPQVIAGQSHLPLLGSLQIQRAESLRYRSLAPKPSGFISRSQPFSLGLKARA